MLPDPAVNASAGTITHAVNAIARGELATDADPAITRIYDELQQLATSHISRDPSCSIQPTDLVHEAFLKLFRPPAANGTQPWQSRAHFFGAAARAMQQLLIDRWRAWSPPADPNGTLSQLTDSPSSQLPALVAAIDELHRQDTTIGEVVRLRIFAGLSVEQTSDILAISPRTVKRYFAFAKTWLYAKLHPDGDTSQPT